MCPIWQVPEESFDINFILHDSNGVYENNNGMDFTYSVEAGITYDTWIDTAAERVVAKELARKVRGRHREMWGFAHLEEVR